PPARRGEEVEHPPQPPRAGELPVDEHQRLAPRTPLRQPRLDIDAAVVELDLVLADRPAVRRWHRGTGQDGLRDGIGHSTHHSWGLMTRPVRALGEKYVDFWGIDRK